MISVGEAFPTFSLANQNGDQVTNDDLKSTPTIFYFYPKDDTSGCTAQACSLRDSIEEIAGYRVIGVSPDGVASHAKFASKYGLNFQLLADEGHALADACGLWVEKSLYGKKYMGVERTTVVVDEKGVVTHVFRKVKPQNHASFLIEELGIAR